MNKIIRLIIISFILLNSVTAMAESMDNFGQVIQISTHLERFVGKPSWLLVIRDVEHGQNIPYLYDIETGNNHWLAFTYSQNYLILASTLQFSPYLINPYRSKAVHNFCHLESMGHIIRGESIQILITGKLSPYATYRCTVTRYPGTNTTNSF